MKPSAGIRESNTPSAATSEFSIAGYSISSTRGEFPARRRVADGPGMSSSRNAVLGEQSGDGMRRLGRVGDDGSGADPLRCSNLSMLRTTTPRRAMMDA